MVMASWMCLTLRCFNEKVKHITSNEMISFLAQQLTTSLCFYMFEDGPELIATLFQDVCVL